MAIAANVCDGAIAIAKIIVVLGPIMGCGGGGADNCTAAISGLAAAAGVPRQRVA